mmetsp:Transcript_21677/g.23230  ORF Transcript_21677/g.23230 Transcript_21677/m.23230 type:complete len:80 (+) Transcript_21677:175-414(+)
MNNWVVSYPLSVKCKRRRRTTLHDLILRNAMKQRNNEDVPMHRHRYCIYSYEMFSLSRTTVLYSDDEHTHIPVSVPPFG